MDMHSDQSSLSINVSTTKTKRRTIRKRVDGNRCQVCNKQFSSAKGLRQHLTKHTKQKPFACEMCKKRFRYKSNLFEHRSIHSGQLPYVCPLCAKSSRLLGNLRKHLLIHQKSGELDDVDAAYEEARGEQKKLQQLNFVMELGDDDDIDGLVSEEELDLSSSTADLSKRKKSFKRRSGSINDSKNRGKSIGKNRVKAGLKKNGLTKSNNNKRDKNWRSSVDECVKAVIRASSKRSKNSSIHTTSASSLNKTNPLKNPRITAQLNSYVTLVKQAAASEAEYKKSGDVKKKEDERRAARLQRRRIAAAAAVN